jgi:hypothetical protein
VEPWYQSQLVRTFKSRWRIERSYEDLKGGLGLDHYEGRSFIGWHHHVSVVLACYAFLVAEQVRSFPPRPETRAHTVRSATRHERHFHDSLTVLAIQLVSDRLLRPYRRPDAPATLLVLGTVAGDFDDQQRVAVEMRRGRPGRFWSSSRPPYRTVNTDAAL